MRCVPTGLTLLRMLLSAPSESSQDGDRICGMGRDVLQR
jgi:hypothetical protein